MRVKATDTSKQENVARTTIQPARTLDPDNSMAALLKLQRQVGNRALRNLFAAGLNCEAGNNLGLGITASRLGSPPQRKLTVSDPLDQSEREADQVAEQIMRMPEPLTSGQPSGFPVEDRANQMLSRITPTSANHVHRVCSECEEELRRRALPEAQRSTVGNETSEVSERTQAYVDSLPGGGQPLPKAAREFFEPRFERDFSQVRVHKDVNASASARSLNARAYTVGHHIVFGEGEYASDTYEGRRLLAHELTHVAQQSNQSSVGRQIQRLTVKNVGATEKLPCGGHRHRWDFQLDSPATDHGYIVQKIEYTEAKAGCDQPVVNATPTTPDLTFWEAWLVLSGERLFYNRMSFGFTDQSGRESNPSTSGMAVASGEIKFFKRSVTGDLGTPKKAGADPDWGPGKEPRSGTLPSTHTEPSWWSGAPEEGPASRLVQSRWNCCGPDSDQYSEVVISP